jgi:hypothetical protein
MAVALPNGKTEGLSGKAVATLKVSPFTLVLTVVAVALGHVKLFGGLDPSVQYFVEAAIATAVIHGYTFLAAYVAKHADPTLVAEAKSAYAEFDPYARAAAAKWEAENADKVAQLPSAPLPEAPPVA